MHDKKPPVRGLFALRESNPASSKKNWVNLPCFCKTNNVKCFDLIPLHTKFVQYQGLTHHTP
jgi:hypothetical protein